MSKSKDKKLFKKYFVDGCQPSPLDVRDYTIEMVAMAEAPLPETYLCNSMKVLNQGSVGSCVAHACATAMGYGEIRGGNAAHDFSRGYIYGNRKATDYQGEGMYLRQALKQLNHCGDCEYADFPYNENYPSIKIKIAKESNRLATLAKPFKIINYFRLYSENEIKRALLNQGAVILSMPIYSSFSAECPLPAKNDKYEGGHAMCLIGWDKTGWIIQNSWSKAWGKKGTLHVPYDYPFNEFWGITVNTDVPQPKKRKWFEKIFLEIAALFKRIFR